MSRPKKISGKITNEVEKNGTHQSPIPGGDNNRVLKEEEELKLNVEMETIEGLLVDANKSNQKPQINLTNFYNENKNINGFPEAFKWLMDVALRGSEEVMLSLGEEYFSEENVKKNFEEASYSDKKGTTQGNNVSKCQLGSFYSTEVGIPKDCMGSLYWSEKEIEQDNISSNVYFGEYTNKKFEGGLIPFKVLEELILAAEQGSAISQYNLGLCYGYGNGLYQDLSKSVEWIKKSANLGFAQAQEALGNMYRHGYGVNRDYEIAFKWYIKAALLNRIEDIKAIAICCLFGYGTPQDVDKANILIKIYNGMKTLQKS